MLVSLCYNSNIVMAKRGTEGSCSLLVITIKQKTKLDGRESRLGLGFHFILLWWEWGVISRTRWTLVYYPWCIILVSRDLVNLCCPSVHLACYIL